jgi:hypothetical protein
MQAKPHRIKHDESENSGVWHVNDVCLAMPGVSAGEAIQAALTSYINSASQ